MSDPVELGDRIIPIEVGPDASECAMVGGELGSRGVRVLFAGKIPHGLLAILDENNADQGAVRANSQTRTWGCVPPHSTSSAITITTSPCSVAARNLRHIT